MLSKNEKLNALVPMKSAKTPMQVLEVDRLTLESFGMNSQEISRIYKTMYVNSVGFFDLMNWCTGAVK